MKNFSENLANRGPRPEHEFLAPKEYVRAAEQAGADIVWLGGAEPLFDPAIGEVASALAESGRYVFLHTSGAGLRQRIHEFDPVNRLYLCLEIPTVDADAPLQAAGISEPSVTVQVVADALRVARLSGFHVCAHFTVAPAASLTDIAARVNWLQSQHVDGIAMSCGGAPSRQADHQSVFKMYQQAVSLIPRAGWRNFSRILEASWRPNVERVLIPERGNPSRGEEEACEETA